MHPGIALTKKIADRARLRCVKAKSVRGALFGLSSIATLAACHDARSTADTTSNAHGAILSSAAPIASTPATSVTGGPSATDASAPTSAGATRPLPAALPAGVTRTPAANVPAASLSAATTANNELGVALFGGLRTRAAGKNFLISPISASLALGMACVGAKGQTRAQMTRALQFGQHTPESIFEGQNALSQALSGRGAEALEQASQAFRGSAPPPSASDYTLQLVNSLWGEASYHWEAPFVAALGANYGAGLNARDFVHQSNAARLEINAWVSAQTNDKIQDLLPPPAVGPDTRLVLVNALHLKLPWETEFRKQATTNAPFTRVDRQQVTVAFMHRQDRLAYVDDGSAQIVALPLSGNRLWVVIALPHAGVSLSSYEGSLRATSAALRVPTQQALVALALPKVTFTSPSFSLAEALKQLGMVEAFSPDHAHFEGMSALPPGAPPLFVSDVLQKTLIAMQETGIEAAAATAVVMSVAGALMQDPPRPIPMIVNRPYLIAIVDEPTGALLMLGQIDDPS